MITLVIKDEGLTSEEYDGKLTTVIGEYTRKEAAKNLRIFV